MGVIETILVIDGTPVEFDSHLERLRWSLENLFAAEVPASVRELVRGHSRGLHLARLRLTVAPAADGALDAHVVTATVDAQDVFPSWERAIALRSFVVPGGLGAHKWADRAGLAQLEADESGCCVPLLLDDNGEALEASRANLFAVEGEVLITPAADGRILPGVARARAIELARSLGIEVREQALTRDRLLAVKEAFLTGSVRGIEPVRSLDEAEFEAPGEAVAALASEMRRSWIGKDAARQVEASLR
jgi:para-aminobenzoate synthetase / 4-amino-4-deoxychorismate lyase